MIPYPRYNPERETLEVWSVRDPYPAGSLEARQFENMLAVASPVTGDLICAWIPFDQWTLPDGNSLPDVGTAFAYLDGQCRTRPGAPVLTASASVFASYALMFDGPGGVVHADPTSPAYAFAGIAAQSAASGQSVVARQRDTVTFSAWAWVPNRPVYVLPGGALTQAVPDSGVLHQVGAALDPTTLLIAPATPFSSEAAPPLALQSFLALVAGRFTRVPPVQSSAGASSAGQIPALNAAGAIDVTMLPSGVGPDTVSGTASEAIAAGAFVNVWSNAGAVALRNANGATGLEAHGYVTAAVASGAQGVAFCNSINTALSGLTIGADYWLSDTTAGGVVTTSPSATGHFSQFIGTAFSATALQFSPGPLVAL